jgi:hypothetical protein
MTATKSDLNRKLAFIPCDEHHHVKGEQHQKTADLGKYRHRVDRL